MTNSNKNITAYLPDVLLLAAIAVFGLWVNRSIEIKGLYMDDLYMWSCYGEQSLAEFVFPIGTSSRFRPVYWLAAYLQMMLVGSHISGFALFNIVINILVSFGLYYIAKRLSGSRICSAVVGICYLVSRFAYYQIGQALGLMETMALAFAIAMLYRLYVFMRSGRGYASILIIYFLLVFTHERYLSLFPLIYLVLVFRCLQSGKGQRLAAVRAQLGRWIVPIAELAAIIAIRCIAIGHAMPAGTGGTEVGDTFSLGEALKFCIEQLLYILGINAGPEYLNGIPWEAEPRRIKLLTAAGIVFIAAAVLIYIAELIRSRKKHGVIAEAVKTGLLFAGFIALCIGCSSVTIRLEMRWIYVSYTAALLYAAYMIGVLSGSCDVMEEEQGAETAADMHGNAAEPGVSDTRHGDEMSGQTAVMHGSAAADRHRTGIYRNAAAVLFCAYAIVTVGINLFCRSYFVRLYFWPNQLRMNSLAEETVGKYGAENVFGKDIYILENSYEMSDFYADTFFKTFDPARRAEGTEVIFADSIADVDTAAVKEGRALVLRELPESNAYEDITEEVSAE